MRIDQRLSKIESAISRQGKEAFISVVVPYDKDPNILENRRRLAIDGHPDSKKKGVSFVCITNYAVNN